MVRSAEVALEGFSLLDGAFTCASEVMVPSTGAMALLANGVEVMSGKAAAGAVDCVTGRSEVVADCEAARSALASEAACGLAGAAAGGELPASNAAVGAATSAAMRWAVVSEVEDASGGAVDSLAASFALVIGCVWTAGSVNGNDCAEAVTAAAIAFAVVGSALALCG